MDRDRWQHIEEVFQSALEHPPEERAAFISQACASSPSLRAEVESLLRQGSGETALDRPAWTGVALGPYRIVERIGGGGMGEVFRAVDTRLDRTVAVKLLRGEFASRPDFRHRFEREARACSALNHPHICALHDIGDQDGVSYLVMEFVEGQTLADRIAKGALPYADVIRYGSEVADALAAAHAAGIVHRDLKPANVVLTASGVKVLDFGLAKVRAPEGRTGEDTATLTAQHAVMGTLAYMAPEQLEGREADARTDIFALGMVLHEMASGKRPFAAESHAGMIAEILRGEPTPLAGVPEAFAHVVRRCLARDPARRWQSAADLRIELQDCATARPQAKRAPPRSLLVPGLWAASVLAALIAGSALRYNPAAIDLSAYGLTPFATTRPYQASPLWSPDGQSIAFVTQEAGRRTLQTQSLKSGIALALTGPDVDVTPFLPGFWSPDSQSLYFTAMRGGESGLYRVPVGGGDEVVAQANALRGTLSPDGQTLVTLGQSAEGFRVWVASPPSAPRRPYDPAPFDAGQWKGRPYVGFSPDGKRILAVVDTERRREAWLLPWPPGKGRRIFEGAMLGPAPQFAWMPDSRHVVVAAALPKAHSQLYIGDTEGASLWRILAQDRPVSSPAVSPDGTQVAYQSSLSTAEIVAAPIAGGPTYSVVGGSRSQQMAHHSPAGPQVVYVSDRRGVAEVWLTNIPDGSDRLLLAPGDVRIGVEPAVGFATPVFSPDARRVAVVATSPTGAAIYTTPASGAMPVRATAEANPSEYAPTWSPDGKWIAFWHIAGPAMRLTKVRPGSGDPPVDLAPCWNRTVPEWSPTGEWIAFHDPASQLTIVRPDGKDARKLGGSGAIAWSRDGRTIYQARLDTHALVAVEVASGRETTIRDLGELAPYSSVNAGWRASLTPDGAAFVYTVNRPREEIWVLGGIHTPRSWLRFW